MNVKELKQLIKDLPDEMHVVVDGYERGLKKVERTKIVEIYDYKNTSTLYGEYISRHDQFFRLEEENRQLTHVGKAFHLSNEYFD